MNKKTIADNIIKKHVLFAMGGSLVPIPVIDIVAVTGIQIDMIKQLGILYDLNYQGSLGKSTLVALTGNSISRIGASMLKGIPVVGTILGGITQTILAGASTLAVGEVMVKHFEKGGTFLDFDLDDWKEYYDERYQQAKETAKSWKEESKSESKSDPEIIEVDSQDVEDADTDSDQNDSAPDNPSSGYPENK